MSDLAEDVEELANRVSHLEAELETSYMEERFERTVYSLAPNDDADVETNQGPYGYHARITNVNGDEVQAIIDRVDGRENIDFAVTETGSGLGVEVWTGEYFD